MKESVMGIRSYPFPIATKFDTICIAIMGHNQHPFAYLQCNNTQLMVWAS
jgi:hypothetical protein